MFTSYVIWTWISRLKMHFRKSKNLLHAQFAKLRQMTNLVIFLHTNLKLYFHSPDHKKDQWGHYSDKCLQYDDSHFHFGPNYSVEKLITLKGIKIYIKPNA